MNEDRKEALQCLQERLYAAIINEKTDCEEMSSVGEDDGISPELEAWLSYVMPIRDYLLEGLHYSESREQQRGYLTVLADLCSETAYKMSWSEFSDDETAYKMVLCLEFVREIDNLTQSYEEEDREGITCALAFALRWLGIWLGSLKWDDLREKEYKRVYESGDPNVALQWIGIWMENAQWDKLRDLAYQKAYELGDLPAGIRLAGLVIRGESCHPEAYSVYQLIDMLWGGIKQQRDDALVYMALVLALKLGTEEDWKLADELVARAFVDWDVQDECVSDPLEIPGVVCSNDMDIYWYDIGAKESLVNLLASVWVSRHGHRVLATKRMIEELRAKMPHAPSWLFEPAK